MEPITAHKYYDQLEACRELKLVGEKETPKKERLAGIVRNYNATLIPAEKTTEETTEETTEAFTIVWKAPIDESQEIENARSQLTAMMKNNDPIETPIAVDEPTALDQAMRSLSPDLAQALQAQFTAMQLAVQAKKPRASSNKEKVDPIAKTIAKNSENSIKYGEIYHKVIALITQGKTRSLAETIVAVEYETSQGRVHHWAVGYHLYSNYPEIREAIDSGNYLFSELILNGLNRDRSILISEKLGVDIEVDIKF